MADGEELEETVVPAVNPYKMGTYDLVRMRINKLMEKPVSSHPSDVQDLVLV